MTVDRKSSGMVTSLLDTPLSKRSDDDQEMKIRRRSFFFVRAIIVIAPPLPLLATHIMHDVMPDADVIITDTARYDGRCRRHWPGGGHGVEREREGIGIGIQTAETRVGGFGVWRN